MGKKRELSNMASDLERLLRSLREWIRDFGALTEKLAESIRELDRMADRMADED